MMRINKYIASCGVTSRRKSEELILSGKVKINGSVVKDLSYQVNPEVDNVRVNNKNISQPNKKKYFILNKPKGYLSTVSDDKGRKVITDIIKTKYRIYPVGRLDYNTEGLIILTNDGDIANKIMHPSHSVDKIYVAKIDGSLDKNDIGLLKKGIELDGVNAFFKDLKIIDCTNSITRVKITMNQGLNRQIRRMFEHINKNVISLKRTAIGEIKLGGMSRMSYRELTDKEILYLNKI